MRIFSDSTREPMNPRHFPHLFAVCRGINPLPQFQIIRIERLRGFDDQALYRFSSEPFENVEWNVVQYGMSDNSLMGQMNVYRPGRNPNSEIIRTQFTILNLFLTSRDEIYPIVHIDDYDALPFTNVAIIPRNARENVDLGYSRHTIMNYLMDGNSFFQNAFNLTNRNRNRLEQYVRTRTFNREIDEDWYNDYDNYLNSTRNILLDYSSQGIEPEQRQRQSAGAGSRTRSRRSDRTASPPRTPPHPIPRPSVLPPDLPSATATERTATQTTAQQTTATQTTTTPSTSSTFPILHAFTIQALIQHAITENMTCPISMNPIQKSTACVTSCQHIFERDSISQWLSTHTNCPVCRQTTSVYA